MADVPASVRILRERGPMDLRAITRATAAALGSDLRYDDVDAVLRGAAERGEARVREDADDRRERVWEAAGG